MPDVVVVVKVENHAFLVKFPRLCRCHVPRRRLVEEEVARRGPTKHGEDQIECGLNAQFFPVPEFHHDVKQGVEQDIGDENCE